MIPPHRRPSRSGHGDHRQSHFQIHGCDDRHRRDGQLVVMARWPAPGRCKRRLAVSSGARRAAAIQARLSAHVLQVAQAAAACHGQELVLAVSGLAGRAARRWGQALGAERTVLQGQGSLGARLQRQLLRARRDGARRVVLIGSDLPDLCSHDLITAFRLLEHNPLVLGPACDGGYWLIGLGGDWPPLFAGDGQAIPWGGDQVLEATLAAAAALGLEPQLLPPRADLDRGVDLRRWR